MSYILNALRRSEQERRAGKTPGLETSILERPAPRKHWVPWLISALICLNGIILGYFIWFHYQPQNSTSNPSIGEPAKTVNNQPTYSKTVRPETEPSLTKQSKSRPPQPGNPIATKPNPPSSQSSISQLVDTQKEGINQRLAELPREPSARANENGKKPQQPTVTGPHPQRSTNPNDSDRNPSPIITPKSTATDDSPPGPKRQTSDQPKRRIPSQDNKPDQPPLLRKMPPEFRRQVPELNINVFVYDENPQQRFVIIDMTKYTTGEKIAEGMQLEEILADSLLVQYKGKKFRIPRP